MRGYMQIESVRETSKVGNSKGAKRLTVAELEKAKSHSSLTTRTAPTSPSGGVAMPTTGTVVVTTAAVVVPIGWCAA